MSTNSIRNKSSAPGETIRQPGNMLFISSIFISTYLTHLFDWMIPTPAPEENYRYQTSSSPVYVHWRNPFCFINEAIDIVENIFKHYKFHVLDNGEN